MMGTMNALEMSWFVDHEACSTCGKFMCGDIIGFGDGRGW